MSQQENHFRSSSPLCTSHHVGVDEPRSKGSPQITATTSAFVSEDKPNPMVDPYWEFVSHPDENSLLPEIEKAEKGLEGLVAPTRNRTFFDNITHRDIPEHLKQAPPVKPSSNFVEEARQELALALSTEERSPRSPRLTASVLADAPEEDIAAAIRQMHENELAFPVTRMRRLPDEPSADPAMLGTREIFNSRPVYDDEYEKIEYFPFNLGLVKNANALHYNERNGATGKSEECEDQVLTPAFSKDASSTSRDMSLTAPTDVCAPRKTLRKGRKGKQRADSHVDSSRGDSLLPRASRKRKSTDDDECKTPKVEEASSKRATSESDGAEGKRNTRKRDIKNCQSVKRPGDVLSKEFLLYRFKFKKVANGTYSCPFPLSMALEEGACNAAFSKEGIRTHISHHVGELKAKKPGQLLPCPYGGSDCKWDEKPPTNRVDPNSGLARHAVQVHLKTGVLACICGKTFSRDDREQIVRHLRTDVHKDWVEEKRETDPNLHFYPDVDDEKLFKEEKEWYEQKQVHVMEEDRGEGPSRPAKRHKSK